MERKPKTNRTHFAEVTGRLMQELYLAEVYVDGEGEKWREIRLTELLFALALSKQVNVREQIVGVADHEGGLLVVWNEPPTPAEEKLVESVWEMLGEVGSNVEHGINEGYGYTPESLKD